MKQGMSSFDIASMVNELQCLIGGRIDKAYQLAREKMLLRIRVPEEGRKDLVIVVGKWLYLASKPQEAPKTPTSFAMLLRKHLKNGKIIKIEQHGFDRVVIFHIEKKENYRLVCEMFKAGNIVLIMDDEIVQPLIPKSWSHREVRAHRKYEFPPASKDFRALDLDDLEDVMNSSKKDIVRTLALDVNLGGQYAEELCLLAGIDKKKRAQELSLGEMQTIFGHMKYLLDSLNKARGGIIVSFGDEQKDTTPFALRIYENYKLLNFELFSQAIEKYLENIKEKEPQDPQYEELKGRYERQLAQQEKAVSNQEKKIEDYKVKAELIYLNYQECERIIDSIRTGIKEQDINELTSNLKETTSFKQIVPEKSEVLIELSDEKGNLRELRLDFKKSVEENAGVYYDKVKKAKEKLEGAKKSLKGSTKKLAGIDLEREEKKRGAKRKSKQFWFEKYRWFISSNGNIVIAGRDARTNDKIVKKYLTDKDRYAHAEIHGAPSVVVKHKNGDFSELTMKEACEFALAHSKAWNAKIGSGTAYWVLSDQVTKTPPSGEFLPRGAFILRGKRNFVTNIQIQLAVGIVEYENAKKVMCAPESAIRTQCESYIVFGPGDMKKSTFTRKLCEIFDAEHEEVARILPPGDVRIIDVIGLPEGTI